MTDYHKPARCVAIRILRKWCSNYDLWQWYLYRHVRRGRIKVYWFSAFDG